MCNINGFKPLSNQNSKILILGSMPSDASLKRQEYYGHQRNVFWPIMLMLFNEAIELEDYSKRIQLLIRNRVAVWDVLQSCSRTGSLDAAIKMDSIQVNDLYNFFSVHKDIRKVCFNGAKAENIYQKHIFPNVKEQFAYLQYVRLPSTSPAHATMTLIDKTQIWQKEIKENYA